MHENLGMSINSAKALIEYEKRTADDAKKKEMAAIETSRNAYEQIALLRESNELASKALLEAQKASSDSERTSKKAFWSNIIAVASLIVAIASFLYAVFSRGA